MNEQKLKKIIEESGVIVSLTRMPSTLHYPLDSAEAQERYAKEKESNFQKAILEGAYDIATSLGAFGGSSSSFQATSPEVHKNTLINLNFAQLISNAGEITQEIEKLRSAKPLLSRLIDANAKSQWELCGTITIETSNKVSSYTENDWESHETKIKGKEAVLDMAMLFYEKILAVYDAEIVERKKSPKIKELAKNLTSNVKQAEKILPTIVKANERAQKALAQGQKPDLKTCNVYIDATTELSELSSQYSVLKKEIDFLTNERIPNLPDFPMLSQNDISADHPIKQEWRRFA